MDVELLDGTVIEDVPEGTSKAELVRLLAAKGHDISWYKPDVPARSAQQPQDRSPTTRTPSMKDFIAPIAAPLEVGAQMMTGIGAQITSGLAGLLGGGTMDERANRVREIQRAMTYQPRMELSQGLSKAVAYPFERAMEATKQAGGHIGEKINSEQGRLAGEAIGEQVIPVVGALAGGASLLKGHRIATENAQRLAAERSLQDAARIDAAKLAVEKYGLSLDPVTSNPTAANRLRVTMADQNALNVKLRQANEAKIANILKDEVGIPRNKALISSSVFDDVRAEAGIPKTEIQRITGFSDPNRVIATKLDDLIPDALIGAKAQAKAIAKRVEEAKGVIQNGATGARLINEIESLRSMARSMYKNQNLKPKDRAVADSYMGIANVFEEMIDLNLQGMGKTALLNQFKQGRTRMAKAYALENATDFNTGLVDPAKLAKITSSDNALTGAFSDIGKIAGNFPDAVGVKSGAPGGLKEFAATHMVRTGPAGAAGYVIGGMFGQPLMGAAGGAAIGELSSILYRNRLANNAALQHAVSIPKDYRGLLIPTGTMRSSMPYAIGGQGMLGVTGLMQNQEEDQQ